jgi:hypothetical protein
VDDTGKAGDATPTGNEAGVRNDRSWAGGGWTPPGAAWPTLTGDNGATQGWYTSSAWMGQSPSSRFNGVTAAPTADPVRHTSNGVSRGVTPPPVHSDAPGFEDPQSDREVVQSEAVAHEAVSEARHRDSEGSRDSDAAADLPDFGETYGRPHIPAPRSSSAGQSGSHRADRTEEFSPGWDAEAARPEEVRPGSDGTLAEPAGSEAPGEDLAALPQRVPAEPDVPTVPEVPAVEPAAQTPELARIATHLRRDDISSPPHERPDGFDVDAILAAVRGVDGVRDASVRTTPDGAYRLRLDLADGADPAEVSRTVARLLQERMGVAAAPPDMPMASPPVVPRRRRRAGHRSAAGNGTGAGAERAGTALGARRGGTPSARPLPTGDRSGPRVTVDHVQVGTAGLDTTVEVRLAVNEQQAVGVATGPAMDGYTLRLAATATVSAVDNLLRSVGRQRERCYVEHSVIVPLGTCEVAVVVVLLAGDGWVEQLAGSAVVTAGDHHRAVVRATLDAVNRRLSALLA